MIPNLGLTNFLEITTSGSGCIVKVTGTGTGATYSLTQITIEERVTELPMKPHAGGVGI